MIPLEEVTGVGPALAKKLRAAFITTAELLAVQNPLDLEVKAKIPEGTARKIVQNARKLIGLDGFVSALKIEQDMVESPRLAIGISSIDEALMGGIETGSIVEFYGPARSGKTRWCAHLAVRVQLSMKDGGLEGRVLWLDSESAFKPWMIRATAYRFGLDPETALGNIRHAKIVLSSQIKEIFEFLPKICAEENVKLVVIDSFTGLYRAEYLGLDALRLRQQELNSLLNKMRRTAAATGTIFLYTNQVMSTINRYAGIPNAPAGGHIIAHASDYRFYTRRKTDAIRIIELQDNAGLPEFSKEVLLGWGGLYESKDTKKKCENEVIEYLKSFGYFGDLSSPDAGNVPLPSPEQRAGD